MHNPIRTLLYELFLEPFLRLFDTVVRLPIAVVSAIRILITRYFQPRTRSEGLLNQTIGPQL